MHRCTQTTVILPTSSVGLRRNRGCKPRQTPLNARPDDPYRGEVAEWSNAAVSKTVVGLRRPRVRIPVSPPLIIEIIAFYVCSVLIPTYQPIIEKTLGRLGMRKAKAQRWAG